jgi:hypothetical protein
MRKAFLVASIMAVLASASPAAAAPEITRGHFELDVFVGECGIGTVHLSWDTLGIVNLVTTRDGGTRDTFMFIEQGTAFDPSTGVTYRLLDRSTQMITLQEGKPFVETAERTFHLTNGGDGALIIHATVHRTILPDGTAVSDISVSSAHCLSSA